MTSEVCESAADGARAREGVDDAGGGAATAVVGRCEGVGGAEVAERMSCGSSQRESVERAGEGVVSAGVTDGAVGAEVVAPMVVGYVGG